MHSSSGSKITRSSLLHTQLFYIFVQLITLYKTLHFNHVMGKGKKREATSKMGIFNHLIKRCILDSVWFPRPKTEHRYEFSNWPLNNLTKNSKRKQYSAREQHR